MATRLDKVQLTGEFRGDPVLATFTPRPITGAWSLELFKPGKREVIHLDKHQKPCWTVAVSEMERLWTGKRQVRQRVAKRPDLKLVN